MREIKFRIYTDNKFYYKCLVGNTNDVKDKKWTCPMVWLEDKKEWVNCDNGIIQQYTGLKDKNGVEIYENDIVVNHLYSKEYKSIIKYGVFNVKCCGCCYQYHKVCGFYLEDLNSDEESDIELDENTLDNLEVIGNIYDNKGDICN